MAAPAATAPRRYARRSARRATPATLSGVRGRPMRALAVSRDTDNLSCDSCIETGNAHSNVVPANSPRVLSFFIGSSLLAVHNIRIEPREELRRYYLFVPPL